MPSADKPLRVIVIDDSAAFRRQVANALEASGLVVAEASEGYEALWRVRAEGVFDLILADIHMPNLDGLEFIREVRKLPEYAEVPIFVITSDGSRERREEGRRAGATAWLLKPPDLSALVHTVHAALLQLIRVKDPNPAAPRSIVAPRSVTPPARTPRNSLPARPPLSSRAPLSTRTSLPPGGSAPASTRALPPASPPSRTPRPSRTPSSRAPRPSRAPLSTRAPIPSPAPLSSPAPLPPPASLPRPTPASSTPERRPSVPGLVQVPEGPGRSRDPGEGSGD